MADRLPYRRSSPCFGSLNHALSVAGTSEEEASLAK
jgi:hypothetical protein